MSVIPKYKGKRVYEHYEKDKHPRIWDVIVIGSGIGGMACAAALAKYGRKVLVLEKHYIPGGYTHSFARKGYQWDAGVHAIGEMKEGDVPYKMMHWLSNGNITMESLGNPYDRFFLPEDFVVEFADNQKDFIADLKQKFPEQEQQITQYFKWVNKAANYAKAFFAFKTFPESLHNIGNNILHTFSRNWWNTTTTQVLDEIGIKGKLRTVLTVHWGYIGSIPNESSFAVHALTHTHFWNGAYYPKGGSKEFATHFLGNVIENDGAVLTKANVKKLIMKNDKAIGVELEDGGEFFAPIVISAAGAKTTVNNFLPTRYQHTKWVKNIKAIKDSPSYICLNLGFKGDITQAGASAANLWLYDTWDNNIKTWDITNPDTTPHILYISFPSLKDSLHNGGKHEKHTGECVTFIDWDTVKDWAASNEDNRPEAYLELKKDMEERLLKQLKARLPKLMEHLDYYELSTPLTSQFYTNASKGAIYGLEASPARFTCQQLRTRTPIKNFYMTGIDIASLGVVGGLTSGVLTAATIDKRIYMKLL